MPERCGCWSCVGDLQSYQTRLAMRQPTVRSVLRFATAASRDALTRSGSLEDRRRAWGAAVS